MAASPFSFHCMICFEEFDPERRYPVVLPCGHTYVCAPCAHKLNRCMECRTSLFQPEPLPRHPVHERHPAGRASSWNTARSGSAHRSPLSAERHPREPTPKKRMPLPKNVVLLSLMEATDLATENAKKATGIETRRQETGREGVGLRMERSASTGSDEDEDVDNEQEKIKMGTSIAIGVCGTYAVAARSGLTIAPRRPSTKKPHRGSSDSKISKHVEDMMRDFTRKNPQDSRGQSSDSEDSAAVDVRTFRLNHGDRVQVVSFDDGWAKLARGYGFVKADSSQLVKVGGSMDRACKLEAMLHSLSIRRHNLKKEQSRIDSFSIKLMQHLQASLLNDDDVTVVAAETFASSPTPAGSEADVHAEERDNKSSSLENENDKNKNNGVSSNERDLSKPFKISRPDSLRIQEQHSGLGCFANNVFGGLGRSHRDSESGREGSDTSFDDHSLIRNALSIPAATAEAFARIYPSPSQPQPSSRRMVDGARVWRERNGRMASTGIDFRTGMSGHMALTSSHAHPHEYLERPNTIRKMSSHTGLSLAKPSF